MTPDKHIENELRELAPALADACKKSVYSVPVGYFDQFADRMLERIQQAQELADISPLLAGLPKKMPYQVPEGYFQHTQVPSLLDTASRSMPYTVPSGYFDELPNEVLRKVAAPATGRVVTMTRSFMKYAAAAVVTGIVAVGAWWFLYNDNAADVGLKTQGQAALATLQQELHELSDQEIIELSHPSDAAYQPIASAQLDDLSGAEVHDLLGDVSDAALQQYLSEFGGRSAPLTN